MNIIVLCVLFGLVTTGLAQTVCVTPNGEEARCIPLRQCRVFTQAIAAKPPPAVIRFLRESQCGYGTEPWVCCGSVARFQSVNSPTTRAPPTRPSGAAYTQQGSNANPRDHRNFRLLPTNCGQQAFDNRVLGGEETALDEYPWMALIEYRDNNGQNAGFSCGGMLISDRYILTAAHCVTGEILTAVGQPSRVRLGEHDLRTSADCRTMVEGSEQYEECNQPPQDINVEEVIPHASYNSDGQQFNDIALIRLARSPTLSYYVQPICVPTSGQRTSVGQNLTVAGWGRTEFTQQSQVKLKASVPMVGPSECTSRYTALGRRIIDQQFCAGGLSGVDSCRGDSGGPLMTTYPNDAKKWFVEGVVSYGPNPCGIKGWPGVYTRVTTYANWILDNMRQ